MIRKAVVGPRNQWHLKLFTCTVGMKNRSRLTVICQVPQNYSVNTLAALLAETHTSTMHLSVDKLSVPGCLYCYVRVNVAACNARVVLCRLLSFHTSIYIQNYTWPSKEL